MRGGGGEASLSPPDGSTSPLNITQSIKLLFQVIFLKVFVIQ